MDYVDLFVALVIVLFFAAFAWCFGTMWQNWKENYEKAKPTNNNNAENQEPRSVTWEEFDRLREKVAELDKWGFSAHHADQEMQEAILQLDKKIGRRFCIRWTEKFTSFSCMVQESYEREFVWANRFDMSEAEAWDTMKQIMKDSASTAIIPSTRSISVRSAH